jgi:hypothetical protein
MTASQYKNILQWTLFFNKSLEEADNVSAIRTLFNALGVAFPNGTVEEATRVLNRNDYLGWRRCDIQEAQDYADKGIPTIVINGKEVIIICPNDSVSNLSYNKELSQIKNKYVKQISEIDTAICKKASAFVYSYGHKLKTNT